MQKYATRGDDSIGKNVPCAAAPPQEDCGANPRQRCQIQRVADLDERRARARRSPDRGFLGIARGYAYRMRGMAGKRPVLSPEEQALFLAAIDGARPLAGRDRVTVPPPPPSVVRVVE